jgi:hypothetical protein
MASKLKGDLVASAFGKASMLEAVKAHAPETMIVDVEALNLIKFDPAFEYTIRENTTSAEKVALGIPLINTKIPWSDLLVKSNSIVEELPVESSSIDREPDDIEISDEHTPKNSLEKKHKLLQPSGAYFSQKNYLTSNML